MTEWNDILPHLNKLRKFEDEEKTEGNYWKIWRYSKDSEIELLWEEDLFSDEIKKQYNIDNPKENDEIVPKRYYSTLDALFIAGSRRDNRCIRRDLLNV